MKRILISLAAASTLAAAALPAAATPAWVPINARQGMIEQRIDMGVRSGQLTRREAFAARQQFRRIAFLEGQYRRSGGGLDLRERRDLEFRLDQLSRQIHYDRHDWQRR